MKSSEAIGQLIDSMEIADSIVRLKIKESMRLIIELGILEREEDRLLSLLQVKNAISRDYNGKNNET